jgi:exonuclease III
VWDGTLKFSSGTNNSRGVVTLISKEVEHEIVQEEKDEEGRWLILKLIIKGMSLTIVNYYGPNEDNPKHLRQLFQKLEEIDTEKIVLAGDYNLVLDINLDKWGGQKKPIKDAK